MASCDVHFMGRYAQKEVVTDIFHAVLYRLQVVIPILQFVIEKKTSRCTFRGSI